MKLANDTHHSHVQESQIDAIQIEKVAKRAELFHLASTKHDDRQDVGDRAEY